MPAWVRIVSVGCLIYFFGVGREPYLRLATDWPSLDDAMLSNEPGKRSRYQNGALKNGMGKSEAVFIMTMTVLIPE
jgi:hypothetical protein